MTEANDPQAKADDTPPPHPLRQLIDPFIDLTQAPRALWGINLITILEGTVYFGILGYLTIYFSDHVFQGIKSADEYSHTMVMVLTAGITVSMFFLGSVCDKKGVRFALITSFALLLLGRLAIAAAPTILGLSPDGLGSALHWVTMGGILLVVIGYGMYFPASYAAVRQFTTPKTAAMGFAMLYALMNLGGWLPSFAFLLRDENFLNLGIPGVFWVYTGLTAVALLVIGLILNRRTVEVTIATAKAETAALKSTENDGNESTTKNEAPQAGPANAKPDKRLEVPWHLWGFIAIIALVIFFRVPQPWNYGVLGVITVGWLMAVLRPKTSHWLHHHPLANPKFCFFIFALIPVQTLFTYNWLILPQYISRAFDGWIGEYFEIAANANPLMVFIAVPIVTAMTRNARVYNMMLIGTLIMAAPAFLLTVGPHPWALFIYLLIMTIGEAMWQPRFLQYAAEIAPEGQTGQYMGVAQLPWFLTKMLVPWLYSGWMMDRYCPAEGAQNTELMWFFFGCIAICSPLLLFLAKGWVGRDFKTKI